MQIIITKTAEKSIKRLNEHIKSKIISGIKKLPFGDIKKLKGYENYYRLRIGDYRILYMINDMSLVIVDVLPRGEAYKKI